MRKTRNSVNSVFIVGEVVDVGIAPKKRGADVRARVKALTERGKTVYVDVYGRDKFSDVMVLACQVGNIVYIEGEFRNAKTERDGTLRMFVSVTYIECVLRRKNVAPPSSDNIIRLLDELDPIGYLGGKR